MRATLIIIQNQADHEAAKALVSKLMQSNEAADRARSTVSRRPQNYPCGADQEVEEADLLHDLGRALGRL